MARGSRRRAGPALRDDPQWYKDAVVYQLHVRAFADSNGDGIGDFRGLAGKLDYLRDLGVTAIWLQPFYPSPLRDDGYDTADYTGVHPDYGTIADVRHFLKEAHRRGLRVITELVLNHTSDQHPWFRKARRAARGSSAREFYVWSDTPERYREARIIFKDFESSNWSWDPVAGAYYWHRFYHHQPDLNFENPAVRRALYRAMEFWLEMGVDGLRLDAVPYLYEREGTNCENLPETHAALKDLRRHVDRKFENRMLLAEANQWPEDAVAYFGEGDECHMAFHFPVMPRMFMAVRMEDRYPILDIMRQTPEIPETCQWAVFLRNHDELTLEMVTDEERDYMYRVYANDPRARINLGIRRRLAPLLANDRRRIELMNGLLLSLPGTPVLYYGDEIGMGDNIYLGDRNGVRTPMQWSSDRNAGFSRANSQRLYLPVIIDPDFHYEAVNVEAQQNNPSSLLWWMRRLIGLRRRHPALGRGNLEFLDPDNRKVLAFIRRFGDESILVVANLSRFSQFVELDLSEFEGVAPRELFGQTPFPRVGELPYLLTLGPHAFYWFSLAPRAEEVEARGRREEQGPLPVIHVDGRWDTIFSRGRRDDLAKPLGEHLASRRWFGGKARGVKGVDVVDVVPLAPAARSAFMLLVEVDYTEGESETYAVPVAIAEGLAAGVIGPEEPGEGIARLRRAGEEAVLHGAFADPSVAAALLAAIETRRSFKGTAGELRGIRTRAYRSIRGEAAEPVEPVPLGVEQSNTSILYGEKLLLKLFRRIERGTNPDLEVGAFLTEKTRFRNLPPVAGHLEYRPEAGEAVTLALLHGFVPNEGDAWRYTLDSLGRYLERVAALPAGTPGPPRPPASAHEAAATEIPEEIRDTVGLYLESARLLGTRTGEMHAALVSRDDNPAFAPEPFTPFYQRSFYQSLRNQTDRSLRLLETKLRDLPADARADARAVLAGEESLLRRFRAVTDRKIRAKRARIHGDYHLGQVLFTGKDFVIIDFEGEPALPVSARRIKRSPLRDVAGMLRSFHYAGHAALRRSIDAGAAGPSDLPRIEPWVDAWIDWVSAAFLAGYLDAAGRSDVLPGDPESLQTILDADLLGKAMYELAYELNNRPGWVRIPLIGILDLAGHRRG